MKNFSISLKNSWYCLIFLTDRTKVKIGYNHSETPYIHFDTPRGLILGPLLLLIFISDILNDIKYQILMILNINDIKQILNDIR